MSRASRIHFALIPALLISGAAALTRAQETKQTPETVMLTYRVKAGSEADLAKVLARHWRTAVDLKLVHDSPHVLVRAADPGNKVRFVEILTWRDGSIPDSPPAAIRELWGEMNKLVESRDGRPGIDIEQVAAVTP